MAVQGASVSVYITKRLKEALKDYPQILTFAFVFDAVAAQCGLCMAQIKLSYASAIKGQVINEDEIDKLIAQVTEFAEEHKHGHSTLYGVNQGQALQPGTNVPYGVPIGQYVNPATEQAVNKAFADTLNVYCNKKFTDNLKKQTPYVNTKSGQISDTQLKIKPGQIVNIDTKQYSDYQTYMNAPIPSGLQGIQSTEGTIGSVGSSVGYTVKIGSSKPVIKFGAWSQEILKEIYRASDFNVDMQQQPSIDGAKVRAMCNKCGECLQVLDYQPFINNTYLDSTVWKEILDFCKDHRHDFEVKPAGRSGRKFKNI
jgi:hypothetical protein